MRSLRLKLIVGALIVLAAVIVSLSLFVYFGQRNALLAVLDGRLIADARALAGHIELDHGQLVLETADEGVAGDGRGSAFRITGPGGALVAASSPPPSVAWPAGTLSKDKPSWTTVRAEGGGPWRIVTWVTRVADEQEDRDAPGGGSKTSALVTIQCAGPCGPVTEELRELATQLVLIGLAAFLIAGGGSFVLAGRALLPIRRINIALANVSESRLDERLDPGPFDKELHPLVGQLNAALDRLDKAFQRERQFTADVSHELRTPVAGILNTLEVLLRKPRSREELEEAHEDNLRIARSMESMIERLLLLARMDAGKARPARRPIALAPLVEEVLAECTPSAREKEVRLRHDISPRLEADLDPDQMKIALGNLVDNAVRYNRTDGTVEVHARPSDEDLIVEVRDSGIGIPDEHLPRIFDRFHRVDPSRAETSGGCGLGLSIVKKIVEAHGGRISASSGPGGSTFTIVIPGAKGHGAAFIVRSSGNK